MSKDLTKRVTALSQPDHQPSGQFESAFEERFYRERLEKLEKIAALGQQTYPNSFGFTHTLTPSIAGVPALLPLGLNADGSPKPAEQLDTEHIEASVAGRLVAIRLQGKAGFATLQQNGERLQIYVRKDDVGEPAFELYKLLDLGDHVGVTGTLMRTRTGELTLKVQKLTFLTKAMLPLPDKHSGLGDIELRYRRRYLDLFTDTGDAPEAPPASGYPEAPASRYPEASASGLIAPQKDLGALAPGENSPSPSRLPARSVFLKRAAILRAIRRFFDERGYLEVETPMLHTVAGGAAARPFTTHHNALDIPLNLRIAPELYLKRLVVGGFDRVYEINRNFRNEGVSTQHNPEFTMLEFYQAYANYHDLMDLTEELIKFVALEVNGTYLAQFPLPKGPEAGKIVEINLGSWNRLSMRGAITHFWPLDPELAPSPSAFDSRENFLDWCEVFRQSTWTQFFAVAPKNTPLPDIVSKFFEAIKEESDKSSIQAPPKETQGQYETAIATTIAIEYSRVRNEGQAWGKAVSNIFEVVAEHRLTQPHIIYDFPLAVSPLSKVKPDDPDWVERFEFYIGGFEVGNAFSELNDPADQLRRFEAQVADKDPESMAEVDHDYVRALGYGLPPTAGEGIGIDRLTMLLTGSRSIRDVILFPLMRPQTRQAEEPEA